MKSIRTVGVLLLVLCFGVPVREARSAGVCGNGVVEGGEECDPGGDLFCDGNPGASSCTTGAQCDGGTNCYFAFGCCKFNCQFVGQGASCFDGNECTDGDHCDNVGRCVGQFKADGTACDDSVFCNGADTCQIGECAGHGGDPCTAATDCQTTCNETSDACESTPFVPCGDDGNACTDDVCDGLGTCTHPALPAGTVCRALATVCDVPELCAGGGSPCPADAFVADGTPCGDLCTVNGQCQAGQCTSGIPLVCDDDDVCNGLETCDSLTGCQPGTPLDCDDDIGCTADTCDAIGGCGHAPEPDGAPCDDGNLCTIIDKCVGGTCVGEEHEFVARDSARIGGESVIDGELLVNEPEGLGKLGPEAQMTAGSRFTADFLTLGRSAIVFDVSTNHFRAPATAIVNGTVSPASLPVLSTWCDLPSFACGGPDVQVPVGQVVRIAPGSYDQITVLNRGTLELDPGTYDVCAIRTTTPTAIRPRGDVVIRVDRDFKLGRFGLFEPYAGSSQVWVGGKAKISTSSVVHGIALRSPDTQTKLGRFVVFDGSLCADTLKTQRAVQLGCPSP
jgi:hypothetical protein